MTSKRTVVHAQHPSENWTDDLPVCKLSGVGFLTNQRYREDGARREEHEFEDRSFHFNIDDTYLYGVFDGHDGCRASEFAYQRLPAELLLGQLTADMNDAQVRMALRQAFLTVEKGFFQSIDDALAEKTEIQLQLPEGLSSYEAYQKYPEEVSKMLALQEEITGGTTAVVALIFKNKLYVANVGDSRALLCKEADGTWKVEQLSVDHDTNNESELLRLSQLGLDVIQIQRNRRIGSQENTRSIGDYSVKGGYKDFDILSFATEEPVIAEPHIFGGYPIDNSFYALILMSDGVYNSLEDATGTETANADITTLVTEELRGQSTLNGVAQAVLDKIGRAHHDAFMEGFSKCQNRDDLTLLVRIFRQGLADNLKSPRGTSKKSLTGLPSVSPGVLPVSVPYNAFSATPGGAAPSLVIPSLPTQASSGSGQNLETPSSTTSTPTNVTSRNPFTVSSSSGTQSSASSSANASPSTALPPDRAPEARAPEARAPEARTEEPSEVNGTDERDEGDVKDERVSPYVDFTVLFKKEVELGEKALYDFETS